MTEAPVAKASPRPAKAGRGGRFVAAGAAVGVSLAAVGGMSAAAQAAEAQPDPPAVQRVVVPQPQTPQQIVIVLPGNGDTAQVLDAISAGTTAVAPEMPAAPAEPAPAPQAQTESGGS